MPMYIFSIEYEVSYKYSYIQETRYSMRCSMESGTFLYFFSFKTSFHRWCSPHVHAQYHFPWIHFKTFLIAALLGMFSFYLKILLFEKKGVHEMGALPPPANNSRHCGGYYSNMRFLHVGLTIFCYIPWRSHETTITNEVFKMPLPWSLTDFCKFVTMLSIMFDKTRCGVFLKYAMRGAGYELQTAW